MTVFKNVILQQAGKTATTSMSGAAQTEIGPPEEYGGRADTLNPEEMFVASINSCLMLVFRHFADKSGVEIESYESSAEGNVEKTREGLRFTSVSVVAQAKVSKPEKLKELAELAEKFCLVSNSVKCPVSYVVNPG
jgi:organic hydroperoxide reductase OsmC/OhrA